MWKLNNMVLNNKWLKEETTREIRKYLEMKKNENSWDAAKAVLKGKLIAVNIYIKTEKRFQINNLTLHLEDL